MAKKKTTSSGFKLPTPKNDAQKALINAIENYSMVIALGCAGTGKTYLAATHAAKALKEKRFKRIILTRPTIPTDGSKSLGYYPGSLFEKMAPWVVPVMSTLKECLGKGDIESQLKNENIEVVPFETIRGRSFEDSFVILDEAQNCTQEEIKAFVTRTGQNSKVVITGDITQSDLGMEHNGLTLLCDLLDRSKALQRYVKCVEFTSDDIVRSGLCQLWVREFEGLQNQNAEKFSDDNIPYFLQ